MPVISEEVAASARRRSSRAPWLLLLPPLLLLLVLGAATVQPLQVGPIVIVSEFLPGEQNGFSIRSGPFGVLATQPMVFRGRLYQGVGSGGALLMKFHYWTHGIAWFRGRRLGQKTR